MRVSGVPSYEWSECEWELRGPAKAWRDWLAAKGIVKGPVHECDEDCPVCPS